jgi:hypothetical protein
LVATELGRIKGRSRQAKCVPHHDKSRIRTGRDAHIAKTDRGLLVTASIFEMMLGSNETICLEEPRFVGHSLESIDNESALEAVKGIAHLSVILRGSITT